MYTSRLAAPPDFKGLPRSTPQIRPHTGATTPTSHRPATSPSEAINASFGLVRVLRGAFGGGWPWLPCGAGMVWSLNRGMDEVSVSEARGCEAARTHNHVMRTINTRLREDSHAFAEFLRILLLRKRREEPSRTGTSSYLEGARSCCPLQTPINRHCSHDHFGSSRCLADERIVVKGPAYVNFRISKQAHGTVLAFVQSLWTRSNSWHTCSDAHRHTPVKKDDPLAECTHLT